MQALTDKKLVIIGGTSGIGLSAARAFVREGAKAVLVGLDELSCNAAAQELGSAVTIVQADARLEGVASEAIEVCQKTYGGFDGLYHVAGGSGRKFGDGPLHEMNVEAWNRTFELNLTSLMLSNQAAVKKFMETGTGGSILNLGTQLGFHPSPRFFATHAYAAAKAAIEGFSRSIAAYYVKQGIRVNVILPGLVDTPMAARAAANASIQAYVKTKQPMEGGRMAKPEDLEGLAVYFMSNQSRFTTGQAIAVDGGWSLSDGQYE
jgi:NAD(P)-dependent dehydrogenase (short-subunit alcohol dehydrogenase family)